jgi:hypothetical protein
MTAARHSPITLSAALLLGAALGLAGMRADRPSPAAATVPSDDAAIAATDSAPSTFAAGRDTAAAASPSAAYSAAWELLKDGKLRRKERRVVGSALLEEWCRIDLRAALHAAFDEDEVTDEDPFAASPYDACSDGIRSQLDLVWELVEAREYDLHTRKLRTHWITLAGHQNPLKLLDHFPKIPAEPQDRQDDPRTQAVEMALAGSINQSADPKLTDAVLAKLVALAVDEDRDRIVNAAAGFLPLWIPEERHLEFLRGANTLVAREIHLRAYTSLLQVHLNHGKKEKLDQIPAEFRDEVMSRLGYPARAPEE